MSAAAVAVAVAVAVAMVMVASLRLLASFSTLEAPNLGEGVGKTSNKGGKMSGATGQEKQGEIVAQFASGTSTNQLTRIAAALKPPSWPPSLRLLVPTTCRYALYSVSSA